MDQQKSDANTAKEKTYQEGRNAEGGLVVDASKYEVTISMR